MAINRVRELAKLGQSIWYDNISRKLQKCCRIFCGKFQYTKAQYNFHTR